jgi:hypothetical protein
MGDYSISFYIHYFHNATSLFIQGHIIFSKKQAIYLDTHILEGRGLSDNAIKHTARNYHNPAKNYNTTHLGRQRFDPYGWLRFCHTLLQRFVCASPTL